MTDYHDCIADSSYFDCDSINNIGDVSGEEIAEGTKIRLRKVKIGDLELNNIEASVIHKQNAPLLVRTIGFGKVCQYKNRQCK
jgi:hypothetical protein